MNASNKLYVVPTVENDESRGYVTEYVVLQNKLQLTEKKYRHVQGAYKKYSELLIRRTEQVDAYKTELCDRSIALNKVTKQLTDKNESYELLYKSFVELQNKQTLLQQNSKIIEFVDALVARFECFKAKISASRGMRMSLFMSAIKTVFSKSKQGADSGVEKRLPVNKWLPTTKAMPAFKGMYRVSDGQHSALSYFNSASHEFANQGFHIKYWQLLG